MAEERVQRRLAAILAADVVGYSRLMERDEAGTHAALKGHRQEIIDPKVTEYHGRIVKLMGDGALVEFASVVDAVECAVDIQRAMAGRNAEMPEDQQIRFRIGINLGDVIVEEADIYGDVINVAARLESLAAPGGICVSQSVFNQAKHKVEVGFEDLGEQNVKNIAEPVRIYRVLLEPQAAGMGVSAVKRLSPDFSDKPSIAVLPFEDMSGEAGQEYFSDGLTEEIITALSQIPALLVIARHSTFVYKGKPVTVQDVSQELGVRYVLEGSVRRADERVRVSAQLIDAQTGLHLWAERYDRQLENIFEIQEDITRNIAIALQIQLSFGEHSRYWQKGTRSFEAWQCQVRALHEFYRFTNDGLSKAVDLFEQATTIDPDYLAAWAGLGYGYAAVARYGFTPEPETALGRAEDIAHRILSADDKHGDGHALLGYLRLAQHRHDDAIAAGRRAVELEPNNPNHHGILALALVFADLPLDALHHIRMAIRLSPHYPNWFTRILIDGYRLSGDLERARECAEDAVRRFPDYPFGHLGLAAVYAELDQQEKAHRAAGEVLRLQPDFSLNELGHIAPFKHPHRLQEYLDALRKAGLPESPA